jgi:hypothetical protein
MPQIFRSKMYSTAFPTAKFYALRADLYDQLPDAKALADADAAKASPPSYP